MTTCLYHNASKQFMWDVEDYQLQCIQSVGLVVGGMLPSTEYTDHVEILAPGYTCKYSNLPNYPYKIVGVALGYTLGQNIVCGGGIMEYVHCHRHPMEGSNVCETDMQCVKTSGGTRWCTGPKTDECYSYDYVSEVWNQAQVSLSKARAYAASVVLPNEELWISGGAGKKSILKSIEIFHVTRA